MQREMIRKTHEGGRFAASKTEEVVGKEIHIDGLRYVVDTVIAKRVKCILQNRKRGKA